MRLLTAFGAGLLALTALAVPPAQVNVRFTAVENFADATYENRPDTRSQVAQDLGAHLVALGQRYLQQGQRLEIEITDVDLAGRYEPWHFRTHDVRYLRDITWPRIELEYRLLADDAEIARGKEALIDMNYLGRGGLRSNSDRLRYEKAMLDQWFRSRFGGMAKQARADVGDADPGPRAQRGVP